MTPECDLILLRGGVSLCWSCGNNRHSYSQYLPLADNQLVTLAVGKVGRNDRISLWPVMDLGLQ